MAEEIQVETIIDPSTTIQEPQILSELNLTVPTTDYSNAIVLQNLNNSSVVSIFPLIKEQTIETNANVSLSPNVPLVSSVNRGLNY